VPVISSDVIGASTVYYTAAANGIVPIWTGSEFSYLSFNSDISLTLNSTILASSTIVDVFGINNSGVLTIAAGPAWSSATPGSCSRGTGAGTTQLTRQNGVLTNAVSITLKNGSTTYSSIPAGQATYLGSIFGDSTAGQTSCYVSYGQSRKWGVWNAYNRKLIVMQAGDSTSSWVYTTNTVRPSNNNSANSISVFTGLAEENVNADFRQNLANGLLGLSQSFANTIGVGLNSTTTFSGYNGTIHGAENNLSGEGTGFNGPPSGSLIVLPSLGLNTLNCLENGGGGAQGIYQGGQANMQITASYLG
jgi:hypothetical protein